MPNIRQMLHLFASRKIVPEEMGIKNFVKRMESGIPITFSRFGDGEWSALIGTVGENCDGHQYSKQLQKGLRTALLGAPKYEVGMQAYALKCMGRDIVKFIKQENLNLHWWQADLFHDANLRGELYPFIKLLQSTTNIVIGPSYLRDLDLFPQKDFIQIPQKNCFEDYDRILTECKTLAKREKKSVIFLFSASMASNVLIDELYKEFGSLHSFLDVGALWDIYLGKKTRGVYSESHWGQTIKKNRGEF